VAVLGLSSLCHGQIAEPPGIDTTIAVVRAELQADKNTVVAQAMSLSDTESAAFWPIYRQYEYERSKLDDAREAVIKEYMDRYPNLTDAEAKLLADRMFDCESRLTALKKTYFKKFNKVLPALTVTKFFQLERRIDLMTDIKIESTLPPLTDAKEAKEAEAAEEPK
jgi:hypothetical protein